jgi:ATPase family associated with various cellular activities (AAA)
MSQPKTDEQRHFEYLLKQLNQTQALLEHVALRDEEVPPPHPGLFYLEEIDNKTPLGRLNEDLQLSPTEYLLLLICLGVELRPTFSELCALISGSKEPSSLPTIALVNKLLASHSESDSDKVKTPSENILDLDQPIFQWQLVTIDLIFPQASAPMRITPWASQFLQGFYYRNPQFSGSLQPKWLNLEPTFTPDIYQNLSNTLLAIWSEFNSPPVTQLIGKDSYAQKMVVAKLCEAYYSTPYLIDARDLSLPPEHISDWITQWRREALIRGYTLLIDCGDPSTLPEGPRQVISELLKTDLERTPLILIGSERFPGTVNAITQDMPTLMPDDQKKLWIHHLRELATPLNGQIGALVSQFNLNAEAIESIATQACTQVKAAKDNALNLQAVTGLLWQACRVQSRSSLDGLVERIEPKTTWKDLILPPDSTLILEQIIATIDQRARVYDEWRMGGNTRRGMGITSLFHGPSGTGKTTAAEIIAHDLQLDLYRVDLSQVSSKYIGETEKNLSKVFDAAESSGAVLLFDEADSIIGKRSEVKDARDRYANQEVGYLLQRMEQYSGLAILTTNLPNSLDSAFMRRIRFSVRFEYPTPAQRAQIWQNCFPETAPTANLSFPRLSQLDVSGASIRNIAMGSAFIAAKAQEPIQMKHILQAAQAELQKLGRSLTDQEIRGWL